MKNLFNESDAITYFEIARVALNNPEIRDYVLSQCDISDEEGEHLQNTLNKALN